MTEDEIKALILRRRLQMLVSSYVYYELNDNLFSDNEWMRRAVDLRKLQEKHPELAEKVEYADMFRGWDGSSGYHLKYDGHTVSVANRMLRIVQEKRKEERL